MSNFDKHVLAFSPTHIRFRLIQQFKDYRVLEKIINFWYTFGWKWWVISFRDYLGLSDACSYDVIDRADRFGFQNFCSPGMELTHLSQLMRLWYLSHRRPAKAQVKYGVDEGSDQKWDIKPHWMAARVYLKNKFKENEKCHNLMSWLISRNVADPQVLL